MANARRPIEENDSVVVVDIAGQLVHDQEQRVMRGTVIRIGLGWDFRGSMRLRVATVSLARSGRQVTVGVDRLRRCPALAYVRPRELSPGVA